MEILEKVFWFVILSSMFIAMPFIMVTILSDYSIR